MTSLALTPRLPYLSYLLISDVATNVSSQQIPESGNNWQRGKKMESLGGRQVCVFEVLFLSDPGKAGQSGPLSTG